MSLRTLVDYIAGVQSGGRFEQEKPTFLVSDRTVLGPSGHDDEFAFLDPLMAVAKFHPEAALDHKKHLVFVLVVVEDEFTLQFVELKVLTIEFSGDVRLPVLGDLGEFLGDVDLVHGDGPLGMFLR
jgi:hypothetical protein